MGAKTEVELENVKQNTTMTLNSCAPEILWQMMYLLSIILFFTNDLQLPQILILILIQSVLSDPSSWITCVQGLTCKRNKLKPELRTDQKHKKWVHKDRAKKNTSWQYKHLFTHRHHWRGTLQIAVKISEVLSVKHWIGRIRSKGFTSETNWESEPI